MTKSPSRPKSPLTSYETWYRDGGLRTYEEAFASTDEKDIEVRKVAQALKERPLSFRGSSVAVLDIGCGTGKFTVLLLGKLFGSAETREIFIDLVDLSSAAFTRFRRLLARSPLNDRARIRSTVENRWGDVVDVELVPPYDIIIADHVFYGEALGEPLVGRIERLLSRSGVAIMSLQSEISDVAKMRSDAGISTNSAEQLARVLAGSGIPYREIPYESQLRLDPRSDSHRAWFFASADTSRADQDALMARHGILDGRGIYSLTNRASIFLFGRRLGEGTRAAAGV